MKSCLITALLLITSLVMSCPYLSFFFNQHETNMLHAQNRRSGNYPSPDLAWPLTSPESLRGFSSRWSITYIISILIDGVFSAVTQASSWVTTNSIWSPLMDRICRWSSWFTFRLWVKRVWLLFDCRLWKAPAAQTSKRCGWKGSWTLFDHLISTSNEACRRFQDWNVLVRACDL